MTQPFTITVKAKRTTKDHKGLSREVLDGACNNISWVIYVKQAVYVYPKVYIIFSSPARPPAAKLLTQRKKTSEFSPALSRGKEQRHSAPLGGATIIQIILPSINDTSTLVKFT